MRTIGAIILATFWAVRFVVNVINVNSKHYLGNLLFSVAELFGILAFAGVIG